jgi:hypothetical protein
LSAVDKDLCSELEVAKIGTRNAALPHNHCVTLGGLTLCGQLVAA